MKKTEWFFDEEVAKLKKERGKDASVRDIYKNFCTLILETAKRQNITSVVTDHIWYIDADNDRYVAINATNGYLDNSLHVKQDSDMSCENPSVGTFIIGNEKIITKYSRKMNR
jgi:hypothetical protein